MDQSVVFIIIFINYHNINMFLTQTQFNTFASHRHW